MKTPHTFLTTIPFSGFYQSCHDSAIDAAEEAMLADSNGDTIPRLLELFFTHCDYSAVYASYARLYAGTLASVFKIPSLTFESLLPRYYNYTTDRIFATISRADLARILHFARGQRLQEVAADWFTFCPGFRSSYPNDPKRWPRIAEWDHNHVGAVLQAYYIATAPKMTGYIFEKWEQFFADDLYEEFSTLEMWLEQAAGTTPAARAIRLADYIRARQERNHHYVAA